MNANRVGSRHPDRFLYMEGYACASPGFPIPFMHAWLFDLETNRFVDPTWGSEGGHYLGVAFSPEFLQKFNATTGYYGVFGTDNWKQLHPFLTNGFPEGAIVNVTPAIEPISTFA
jgi:hypothetical protein